MFLCAVNFYHYYPVYNNFGIYKKISTLLIKIFLIIFFYSKKY